MMTSLGSARASSVASVLPTKPHTPVIKILTGFARSSRGEADLPGFDDLFGDLSQIFGDRPVRVVRRHLPQIAVVADVVADPVLVHVGIPLTAAAGRLGQRE